MRSPEKIGINKFHKPESDELIDLKTTRPTNEHWFRLVRFMMGQRIFSLRSYPQFRSFTDL